MKRIASGLLVVSVLCVTLVLSGIDATQAALQSNSARVYTTDQSSNTVSVFDPQSATLLGQIALGNPRPNVLGPKYYTQLNVHGIAASPNGKQLAVVSVTSNAVTFIDTATNQVRGTVYVGRAPHEPMFTPDGKEVWVAVRGQDYLSVIDPDTLREKRRVKTVANPSKVQFSPDGKLAYVNSAEVAQFDVLETKTGKRVVQLPVVSPFAPDSTITRDGKEVWITHKDVGKVTQIDAINFQVMNVFDTGKVTNHVWNVVNANGDFIYVTVGGQNEVVVIRRGNLTEIVDRFAVGPLPHGITANPEGTRVYIVDEDGDALQVIDTSTNQVIQTVRIGQGPQTLIYVPGATGGASVSPIAERPVIQLHLQPPDGSAAAGKAVVRSQGGTDALELALQGLNANESYAVYLAENQSAPFGVMQLVGEYAADGAGKIEGGASAVIFGATITEGDGTTHALDYLVVTSQNGLPVLVADRSVNAAP